MDSEFARMSRKRALEIEQDDMYTVKCLDCRINRRFLTPQGVNAFKMEHADHRLEETAPVEPEEGHVIKGSSDQVMLLRPKEAEPETETDNAREMENVLEGTLGQAAEQAPELELPQEVVAMEPPVVKQEAAPVVGPVVVKEPAPAPAQVPKQVTVVVDVPRTQTRTVPLLLAKSSYVQDGDEVLQEATRVSKVLKEFRWNVEPPYTIGVVLDDNLSIETSTGVLSSKLLERIESLGYDLVAVNAPRGSPVAWFKKKQEGAVQAADPEADNLPDLTGVPQN